MVRVRRLLRENWAGPTSVLLHGLVLAAVIATLAPAPVTIGEKAVPITLVNLAPPPPPPPPAPAVEPLPPPIATTAPEVHEAAPPPKKPHPKREVKKPPVPQPQPNVTNVAPSPESALQPLSSPSEMPVQRPQSTNPSPAYLSLLFKTLERNKVYPHAARIRKEQGTAVLRFVIDRNGHVLAHKLEKSSGHGDLDQEVEEMLARAQPFPQMPAEMTQAQLELVVPIQFSLR